MKRALKITDILSPLAEVPHQAYLNDMLQVADVLQWILSQTGPADVQMASFSLSDEFLRRLHFIQKDGLVRSLDIVLDFKATNKTLSLWNFIEQTVDHCYLANIHAKLLLVSNDDWEVLMVTSQNLTRGNRFEVAVIEAASPLFVKLKAELNYIITKQSVPFHEVYKRTTDRD